jgi:HlyD family secretion protein
MSPESKRDRRSLRRHALAGCLTVMLLVGGVGGWAATTQLSGAVIAPGVVVVDSNVKKVQHPTGGIVGELLVRDGSRMQAGDVLIRLDDTLTRANLAIVVKSLDELAARQARLEAERDDAESVSVPEELILRVDNTDVARVIAAEEKLFQFRKLARLGQKAQLTERIAQLREEIGSLAGQASAKGREIDLIGRELDAARELWAKNLMPISRLTALEREAVRLEGERNQLLAAAAQAKGKSTETELQIIQVDQDLRSEVSRELREIQSKTGEFVERKVAAQDQLKRIEVRAPQDGVVHQLTVHTLGGVVSPGEPIMLIVPEADELTIEARIAPQEIDQVQLGQPAVVRFAAFNQRTTPEINGIVTRLSADVAQDQRTGLSYYTARIGMPSAEISRLNGLKLVPGMPVEAFMRTEDRTVISYLIKPLQDQIAKVFRER